MESGGLFAPANRNAQASQQTERVQPVNMEWQEPIQERAPIPVRQEQLLDHFHHEEFMMGHGVNGNLTRFMLKEIGPSRGRAFMVDSDLGIKVIN